MGLWIGVAGVCLGLVAGSSIQAQQEKPVPVTVQLTPSQHAAIVWALAQPRGQEIPGMGGGKDAPTTVEAYLHRLIRVSLRPVERLKLDDDAKVAEKSRKTLEQRLAKLTVAQCLRLASELAVTTDKLPCGAGGRK